MEGKLRHAVDLLGNTSKYGMPEEEIFMEMEEMNKLVSSTTEAAISEHLTSPEMVMLLAADDVRVCGTAVRILTSMVGRLGVQVNAVLADHEGFLELLDELVYKLSTIIDAQCARSIVILLMAMVENSDEVLDLFCQKYRGIRPVLKRWQGDGFDLLLKKFGDVVVSGDLQLAEAEHRRRAATVIQAVFRGHRLRKRLARASGAIARLQRRLRLRRGRMLRHKFAMAQEENLTFSNDLERQKQRRQHRERVFQDVCGISAAKVPTYLRERRQAAAARIQCAWRAYRVRRQSPRWRETRRRHLAAVTIQRWWRHCLIRVRAGGVRDGPIIELTDQDVDKYQQRINSWLESARTERPDRCPDRAELEADLAESQRLFSRLMRRLAGDVDGRRRCRSLLAQTQAICDLLERPVDGPPPAEFWCPARRLAARARQLHERALARAAAPWWQRLDDFDDGYGPPPLSEAAAEAGGRATVRDPPPCAPADGTRQ